MTDKPKNIYSCSKVHELIRTLHLISIINIGKMPTNEVDLWCTAQSNIKIAENALLDFFNINTPEELRNRIRRYFLDKEYEECDLKLKLAEKDAIINRLEALIKFTQKRHTRDIDVYNAYEKGHDDLLDELTQAVKRILNEKSP